MWYRRAVTETHRSGFVTIVGRPNAGKSTLLNALLGEKLAIVTAKPQTTRHRIRGILPVENGQLVFVDTPGVHRGKKALNRHLRELALQTIPDVDAIVYVRDATRVANEDDRVVIDAIRASKKPAVAVLNKVDRVKKPKLLPIMAELAEAGVFQAIVPVSATRADGLEPLLDEVRAIVPEGPPLYPPDELTDRPVRFLAAELIREQLFLALADELPYSVAVQVTKFSPREGRRLVDVDATIHVERESQKGIVVGKGGERIKVIATRAREEIERLIDSKVNLQLFVRVEPNWTKSDKGLKKLGYTEEQ